MSIDQRLLDAMRAIQDGGTGIALITAADGKLIGILTDGDIRRALIGGATLESPLTPLVQRRFVAVSPEVGRVEVLDLMQARFLSQIPVVDRQGRVCGLHLLREVIGGEVRANWAMIMAGGQGTRLRPVTEKLPKPMIRVAGRPILERLLLHVVGFGVRRIYMAINYLGHVIEDHFGDGSRFGCEIHYLRETEPMGSGGALSLLPERPTRPLLVMNGDLLTQANLDHMLRFHDDGGLVATMGVKRYTHQVPYGCVETDGGRLVRLEEKPVMERLVNAGLYVLSPAILDRVPRGFFPMTELFEDALRRGEPVGSFEIEEEWLDVGQKEQLRPGVQAT